jgi:hypothetical protein
VCAYHEFARPAATIGHEHFSIRGAALSIVFLGADLLSKCLRSLALIDLKNSALQLITPTLSFSARWRFGVQVLTKISRMMQGETAPARK